MSDLPKPPEGMFWRVKEASFLLGVIVELRKKKFGPFSELVDEACVDGPDDSVHGACNRLLERFQVRELYRKFREDTMSRYGGDNDRM